MPKTPYVTPALLIQNPNTDDEVEKVENPNIVRVVVGKISRNVDRPFDYGVPESMAEHVQIGLRVIVPFGIKNMLIEGFVVETGISHSNAKSLKDIDSIVDISPVFDQSTWTLAKWMHDKYLCTYIDAIRVMIPTGTTVKFETWVQLCDMDADERDSMLKRAGARRDVVEKLQNEGEGGLMEINRLMSMFESNIRATISALEKQGIVSLVQRDSTQIKDKVVRFASICLDSDRAQIVIDELKKKAPKQAAVLEILLYNEKVAVCDLAELAQTTSNTLAALAKKELVQLEDIQVMRNPLLGRNIDIEESKEPTHQQQAALKTLNTSLQSESGERFLIHGVTGSGKTEVYMQLIANAIKQGKTAIVLVPEISLTPQMTRRFASRFGERIAILHSALSIGERYDEWKRIRSGEVDVVVGARSAIFAPLRNIGVIILDEEHENTYKSEMSPRYHAREVAIFRAEQHKALCILASATPAVESYYNAKQGEYTLIKLHSRYNDNALPSTHIVDMRQELAQGNRSMFSQEMRVSLEENLKSGEQSILFLNRRGYSTFVSCRECGYVAKCPHCNISLTYHSYTNQLTCHYCGYTCDNYTVCPECNSKYIKYFGAGTQRVEEELKKEFADIGVVRMDVDTTTAKNSHERLLEKFEKEKVNVLIGTQMVAKGLDMHNVTLVGVVAADSALYIDDYRSCERTFHLITQVTGRAGRGQKPGRAIVQTYSPENSAIVYAKNHDYEGFYDEEIEMRRAMWYPPFCDIVSILVSGKNESLVIRRIRDVAKQVHFCMDNGEYGRAVILGPVASGISKIKDKYRWRLVIKCEQADQLNDMLYEIIANHSKSEHGKLLDLVIDKNPNSLA